MQFDLFSNERQGRDPASFQLSIRTVYVDDAIHPWRGRKWAHLFCEDIEVLHGFALRLGLKRSWFQCPPKASWPHYDVTDTIRFKALHMGAVAADRYTALEVGLKLQGRLTQDWVRRLDALRSRSRSECVGL